MHKNQFISRLVSFYLTFAIPLLYLYNLLVIMQNGHTVKIPLSLIFLGFFFALLGCTGWIICFINLGKSFGVLPQRQKRIHRGLYKFTSHPMYISIWLAFLGLSLANESWEGLVFLNIVTIPVLFIRATLENKKLYE